MNSKQLEVLLKKMDLPESIDVSPTQESIDLLRKFGIYDESIVGAEAREGILLQDRGRRPTTKGRPSKDSGEVEDPEFEKKHPRDASGKFAKKEEEGEENGETDYSVLDEEPWPGVDLDGGLKGVIELDGVKYKVVGDVSKEEFVAFHEIQLRMMDRSSEILDYPMKPADIVLINRGDYKAVTKYTNKYLNYEIDENTVKLAYQENEMVAVYDYKGQVIMDTGLLDRPDILEPILFHETLHTQPRLKDQDRGGSKRSGNIEERFNTLITMEYAEKFGLAVVNGYPLLVSQMVHAANELGWSKQKLYSYARSAHKVDGDLYATLQNTLFEQTGTTREKGYRSEMDAFAPSWSDVWDDVGEIYNWDFDLEKELWIQ